MFTRRPKSKSRRAWTLLSAFLLCCLLSLWALHRAVLWWIDFSEDPFPSDVLVILAGDYARTPHAAELFKKGYAPEIWLSRPRRIPQEELLLRLGLPAQPEDWYQREILRRSGVPDARIRLYAEGVDGTRDEALALAKALGAEKRRVLLVTSRFHARRTRLVFRRALPGREIVVTATPYDGFQRRWWRDKQLAQNVLLEFFKLAFYLLGGSFRAT